MERIYNDDVRNALGNSAQGKAGLAEGTAAATIQVATLFDFSIAGIMYQKAITDSIAITAGVVQAVSTHCLYLCTIDKAGVVTVTKGVEAKTTEDIFLPSTPADSCVWGAFKIETDGSNTYTAGTTDNSATGITDVYWDLQRNWRKTFLGVT